MINKTIDMTDVGTIQTRMLSSRLNTYLCLCDSGEMHRGAHYLGIEMDGKILLMGVGSRVIDRSVLKLDAQWIVNGHSYNPVCGRGTYRMLLSVGTGSCYHESMVTATDLQGSECAPPTLQDVMAGFDPAARTRALDLMYFVARS